MASSLAVSSLGYSQRPYARRRPKVTTYHEAILRGVEKYKDERYASDFLFAISGIQPPTGSLVTTEGELIDRKAAEKKTIYTWLLQNGWAAINPVFSLWPWVPQVNPVTPGLNLVTNPGLIFNPTAITQTQPLLFNGQPGAWKDEFAPLWTLGATSSMADIEKLNQDQHDAARLSPDFYTAENIGLRKDWFTDAVFAQHAFTGPSPATIALASESIKTSFAKAAHDQYNFTTESLINSTYASQELYVQDCQYFRAAVGLDGNDTIVTSDGGVLTDGAFTRYGCAPVTLYTLSPTSGLLHPIAICIDYVEDETQRVTIFNKRLYPAKSGTCDELALEAADWPWRYAKTCAQVADWSRHELAAHLVETHLIEEAIIVAAERNMDDSHIVLEIMHSHWITTLSLNANVRPTLVLQLIQPICPFDLKHVGKFVQYHRQTFDFKKRYVPVDLESRGFPTAKLADPKFHNYTYGRGVYRTWGLIHDYVSEILTGHYKNDEAVVNDTQFQAFIKEMHEGDGLVNDGGYLPLFPTASTISEVVDIVTLCIHIASAQHTAVNYLQQYYMTFIPNRPGALYTPLPKSIDTLNGYTEQDLLNALPLKAEKDWILMAQVPYLLSAEVDVNDNLNAYAINVAKSKNPLIAGAGLKLKANLVDLANDLITYARQNDDKVFEYSVLYPDVQTSAIVL